MKNSKTVKLMLVMVMGLFITNGIAQAKSENDIPQAVVLSLNNKYPGAIVKKWKVQNNAYTAKTIVGGHKYFATFDKSGNWVSTASSVNWAYKLPKIIRSAQQKTPYNNWTVYFAKKVVKPSGEFYQLMVDDVNLHVGVNNQAVLTQDKMLEFKADGTLTRIKDISSNPQP